MKLDFDIDFDNLCPETWFGEEPGKKVCLRLCPTEKVEEFNKQCLTAKKRAVLNTATRKMELADDSDFDNDRFFDLMNSYCIVDWDLTDVNGTAIACTDENKKLLMNMPRFARFVKECLIELNRAAGLLKEEESKNSESSQGE